MTKSLNPGAERLAARILRGGLWAAGLAAGLLLVAHTINVVFLGGRVFQFDASQEHTIFTWATTSATFAAAFAAALHAMTMATNVGLYAGTALVLAFFSLDDTIELHERLGNRLAAEVDFPSYVGTRAWILVYLPLLAFAAALLWLVSTRTAEPMRRYLLVGLGLLLSGVVLEAVGIGTNRLLESGVETPHRVRAGFEESVELAGWALVAAGLTASLVWRIAQWQRPEPESENPRGSTGTKRQS